jgi:arabinofuranosyltransferase
MAAYVVWAALFIAKSTVETDEGRYHCLFDDAMVSLRYAWNLAHGEGLTWNPGERVEGTTCFLFTLYMSLGALLFDKSGAALFVQITGVALVLGVALLARRLSLALGAAPLLGLVTVAAVLGYYPLSYWSLMGMETGLLTALSLWSLLVALRRGSDTRGSPVLGLLLGLSFATRPDAALPAVVILAFRAGWILKQQGRPSALRPWLVEVAPFVVIAAALTLFRLVYYGALLPNTYDLKMGGWPLAPRLENGWKFVGPFLDGSRYLLLGAVASVAFHRDRARLLLLAFAGSVVALQIWVGGDAWRYWRLLVPAVVLCIVLSVDAAATLMRWLVGSARQALVASFALACSGGALWLANRPFFSELRLEVPPYMVYLNRRSVKVALELSRYVDPQGSVAVMAAGTVPYYSGLRGVDVLGKSDRHVARLPPRGVGTTITPGHNKFDLNYSIGELRPDVIYDALAWARHEPGVFERVSRQYAPAGSFWFRRDSPHVRWSQLPAR